MPKPLTEAEAFLRVALLVSRADGHEAPEEMMAAATALGNRLGSPSVDHAQLWDATTEVTTTPAREVLRRVGRALPEKQSRLHAFEVACEVAKADRKLHWDETAQMVEVAHALGLKADEIQAVAAAYWN